MIVSDASFVPSSWSNPRRNYLNTPRERPKCLFRTVERIDFYPIYPLSEFCSSSKKDNSKRQTCTKPRQKREKSEEQRCLRQTPRIESRLSDSIRHNPPFTTPNTNPLHQRFTPHTPHPRRSPHHHRAPPHRLNPPRTLKQRTTNHPRHHTVRRVMLPPQVPNRRINPIVHQRQHPPAVPQERPPPRHPIQHTIQLQPRRGTRRTLPQPLRETPDAPRAEAEEVDAPGAVAEVVAPPARRKRGLGAREGRERGFVEVEVGECCVEPGEGVED